MNVNKIFKLLFFTSLFISCEQISQSIDETFNPNVQEKKNEKLEVEIPVFSEELIEDIPIASNIDALNEAEMKLRKLPQFVDQKINIYSTAHFYQDGRIILNIQDPKIPRNIDKYVYRNSEWQVPEPVQISIHDDIEERTVNLDKVPFEMANKVYEVHAELAADLEIPMRETIYFAIFKNKVRWYPTSLKTERSSFSIEFDEKGNLISFEQN